VGVFVNLALFSVIIWVYMASFIQKYYSIFFIIFLAVIVGLSFYLGYEEGSNTKSVGEKQIVFSCPNTILDKQRITSLPSQNSSNLTASATSDVSENSTQSSGAYMGSKNGTKYYTPNCPASKRIKPENVIWFQSAQDATLQGYSKGSC
jgi:hypothetical protein